MEATLQDWRHLGTSLRLVRRDNSAVVVDRVTGAWVYVDGQLPDRKTEPNIYPPHHLSLTRFAALDAVLRDKSLHTGGATPAGAGHRLDSIIIKLTNKCNEACTYCYDFKGQPPAELTASQIEDVIRQALDLCRTHLNIIFHGGEPLMRFRVLRTSVAFAKRRASEVGKHISFTIQTNASILNDEIVSFLDENRFAVGVSLDGDEDLHDAHRVMRNGRGTYRLFLRSYEKYPDFMRRRCSVLTTITSTNVKALPQVVEHFQSMGFSTWATSIFDPVGRGKELHHLSVDVNDYCASFEEIVRRIETGSISAIAVTPLLELLDNILLGVRRHMCLPGNGPCGAASKLLNIEADGTLSGCDVIHDPAYALGHLGRDSLSAALQSQVAQLIRKRPSHLNTCNRCTWLGICGGTCFGRSSYSGLDRFECEVQQRLIEFLIFRIKGNGPLLNYYSKWEETTALGPAE